MLLRALACSSRRPCGWVAQATRLFRSATRQPAPLWLGSIRALACSSRRPRRPVSTVRYEPFRERMGPRVQLATPSSLTSVSGFSEGAEPRTRGAHAPRNCPCPIRSKNDEFYCSAPELCLISIPCKAWEAQNTSSRPSINAVRKTVSQENRSVCKMVFVKNLGKQPGAELCLICIAKRRFDFK